ncbi:hypothetical protein [Neisseria montereyensis]|uniref:Type VI secretion system tip protein VgrG n=1 Tax=Neisseria montereyensis TaxID=2973938 RepID=A0ABT2FDM0_9NEIS|nr:hypothetical protein [Neisseria montereyensis]MCS4534232.1 hypothetical protein [Neisseria montereyensis]
MNKPLIFKRGETVEITLLFDILDDYGISALSGVDALARIRPKFGTDVVADFAVDVYPEQNRLLLTLSPDQSAMLKEGAYIADVAFTRLSDGLVQMSGDIAVEIIKGTSHVG